MLPQAKNRRACLMDGMADRLGVDVDHAVSAKVIARDEAEDMVKRCSQCTQHDACILWMMGHLDHIDMPPEYCLNTQELQYLRREQLAPTA